MCCFRPPATRWTLGIGEALLCVCQNYVVFSRVCSKEIGEALDLDHAIIWSSELQLANVDFKVDSKKVADY